MNNPNKNNEKVIDTNTGGIIAYCNEGDSYVHVACVIDGAEELEHVAMDCLHHLDHNECAECGKPFLPIVTTDPISNTGFEDHGL